LQGRKIKPSRHRYHSLAISYHLLYKKAFLGNAPYIFSWIVLTISICGGCILTLPSPPPPQQGQPDGAILACANCEYSPLFCTHPLAHNGNAKKGTRTTAHLGGGGGGGCVPACSHHQSFFSWISKPIGIHNSVCRSREKPCFVSAWNYPPPPPAPKGGGGVKVVCGYVQKQTRALHKYSVCAYEIVYRITGGLLNELFTESKAIKAQNAYLIFQRKVGKYFKEYQCTSRKK
jgi:hypothetical protein